MWYKRVSNERLCKFARQLNDWFSGVEKGHLDPEEVASAVQEVIDRSANRIRADVAVAYFGRDILKKRVLAYVEMVIKLDQEMGKTVNIVVDEEYINSVEERLGLGLNKRRVEEFRDYVKKMYLRKKLNDPNYDFMDYEYLVRAVIDVCLNQIIPGRTLISGFSREAREENNYTYEKIIKGLMELDYTPREQAEMAFKHFCSL